MADAIHTQSTQDESEARPSTCAQLHSDESPSAAVLPLGETSAQSAGASSARFLQLPTFSFTPATPSPPPSLSHDGIDDSLIEGLLSGEANSLCSTSLGKVSTLESKPLGYSGVSGGDIPDSGSGSNVDLVEKLPGVSQSSLEKLSSLVDSTKLNYGESTGLAECLGQSNDLPKSPAHSIDSQSQPEVLLSKGVDKPSHVAPTDSPEKLQAVNSELCDRSSENSFHLDAGVPAVRKQDGANAMNDPVECSNGKIPDSNNDGVDVPPSSAGGNSKTSHGASAMNDPVECSNGKIPDSNNDRVDVPQSSAGGNSKTSLPVKLGEMSPTLHPRKDVEVSGSEKLFETCNVDKEQSFAVKSPEHVSENNLPSGLPSPSDDPLSLPDASDEGSKCYAENPPTSETRDICEKEVDSNIEAMDVIVNSAMLNVDSSPSLRGCTGDSEPMEVDHENGAEKPELLSAIPEEKGDLPDATEAQTVRENPLPEPTLSNDAKKTDCGLAKEGEIRGVSPVLLNDLEPLQPVTIGGSLQPLEEVQEANMLNDPSFTADLSLIDSSADEADSIGGLVINSVIGAADGVADFPPDDEMEADRQLTDISSSAPRMVQESCDLDSCEDNGPSAKRRKLENGEKDIDEKLEDSKKVVFKVAPVKNGHGLWDSLKLKEILLSKGTIHLRIHASSDDVDNFDSEKCEIEVDFTCVMVSAVEEDCYQVFSTQEPDSDVCDPLAIGTNAVEHNSPQHYARPFAPQTRGRSTALQPAMPRPPYRQLQSPPHVYNKNEVLGLPQPLEFEEPQMGATDWSGMDSRPVTSSVHAGPYQPSLVGKPSLPQSSHNQKPDTKKNPKQRKETDEETSKKQGVMWRKVCEHCGRIFNKCQPYLFHIRTHRPLLNCDVCNFFTKDTRKFRFHTETHKKGNPHVECNVCKARFATERSLKVHMRRIHGIIRCKDCRESFIGEEVYASHREEVHNDPDLRKGYLSKSGSQSKEVVSIFKGPQPSSRGEHVCRLCNKESRNKYQLKIHIAQHLGVNSDKISDEFLATQDMDLFEYEVGGQSRRDILRRDGSKRPPRQCTTNRIPIEGNFQGISHSNEKISEDSSKKDHQIMTSALEFPIKTEPCDTPFDQSNSSFSAPSSDEYNFVAVAKEEPPDSSVFQAPTFEAPQDQPPAHNLIATSVDSSMLDLQQSMLRSLHSMIFPSGNMMTSLPVASMPSTSFAVTNPAAQFASEQSNAAIKIRIPRLKPTRPRASRIKPKVYCNECPQEFSSYKQLQKHQVKHRKEELRKSFTCPLCDKASLSAVRLARHFKSQHKDKLRCRYHCALLFGTKEEVFAHYKEVHKVETTIYACPHCGLEYLMEGFLLNHLERCTKCPPEKRPVHVCGNCQAILRTRREYNLHIRKCVLSSTNSKDGVHSSEGFIIANERPTDTYESLEGDDGFQRFESSNESTMDGCEILEITDGIQDNPQVEDTRVNEEPMSLDSLDLLRKTKVPVYPFECKFCKQGFNNMEVAVEHCHSAHLNKVRQMWVQRHACQMCDYEVSSKLNYCKHILNHYRLDNKCDDIVPRNLMEIAFAKNFCWICGFTLQGNITRHLTQRNKSIEFFLNTHQEDSTTTFGCTYCLEHFTQRQDYWRHVKKHLNKLSLVGVYPPMSKETMDNPEPGNSEPYECSICLLIFTEGEAFYKHLASHAVFCNEWKNREGHEAAGGGEEKNFKEGKAGVGKENEEEVGNEERPDEDNE